MTKVRQHKKDKQEQRRHRADRRRMESYGPPLFSYMTVVNSLRLNLNHHMIASYDIMYEGGKMCGVEITYIGGATKILNTAEAAIFLKIAGDTVYEQRLKDAQAVNISAPSSDGDQVVQPAGPVHPYDAASD